MSLTVADLDDVLILERDGFDHARWSDASWRAELEGADRLVIGERDHDQLLGVATFQHMLDVADLHRVVVAPAARGRGVGTRLVRHGMSWARAEGAERMLLEVEHENAPALALYERLGFTRIDTRLDYYGPGAHALVLERRLDEEERP